MSHYAGEYGTAGLPKINWHLLNSNVQWSLQKLFISRANYAALCTPGSIAKMEDDVRHHRQ